MNSVTKSNLLRRSGILFVNFFLIILAYYQVKSASRSIFLEYWGADLLPYVWIVSALVLGSIIGVYHRLVERHTRLNVVLGALTCVIALLVLLRLLLGQENRHAAFAFYIFVDIFSVILVEQFWSLANTVNNTQDGKRSYWFIGTGGLLGGGMGGLLAAKLIEHTSMTTPDLLLSCAVLLGFTFALNLYIGRLGLYREVETGSRPVVAAGDWRQLVKSRYLLLIAATLFCSQLAQPIVEYQWAKSIEAVYTNLDERTQFYGRFFGWLSVVSIGVNLILTPLIHRYFGVIAGMLTQPLLLATCSFGFLLSPTLWVSSVMKISDRGLSYSINRASKELLYIPVDPVRTYQAKAWIDMLGYRLFKVLGSALILLFIGFLPQGTSPLYLSWLTLAVCVGWLWVISALSREYNSYTLQPAVA